MLSYRSIASTACILAIGLTGCVGLRQETRSRQPSQSILPVSLSDSVRILFRLSQANSPADEEGVKRVHERRPDLTGVAEQFGNDPLDLARELELAEAYKAEGLDAPALRLYEELRLKGITDGRMELGLAQILHRYNDPTALQHAAKAVELDPGMSAAWELLGRIYLQAKRTDDALAAWSMACRLDPDNANLLNNIGYSFVLAGDWASARIYLEGAVRIDSPLVQAQNNLGIVLARLGDDDGALRAFRTVNAPAAAYNNLGVVYLAQGLKAEAAKAFSQALAIDSTYSLAQKNFAELSAARAWSTILNLPIFGTMNGVSPVAAAAVPNWMERAAGSMNDARFSTIVNLAPFPDQTATLEPSNAPASARIVAPNALHQDTLTTSQWDGPLDLPDFAESVMKDSGTRLAKPWKTLDVQLLRPEAWTVIAVELEPAAPPLDLAAAQTQAVTDKRIKTSIPPMFWWVPLLAAAAGVGGGGKRGMFVGCLCGAVIAASMFLSA